MESVFQLFFSKVKQVNRLFCAAGNYFVAAIVYLNGWKLDLLRVYIYLLKFLFNSVSRTLSVARFRPNYFSSLALLIFSLTIGHTRVRLASQKPSQSSATLEVEALETFFQPAVLLIADQEVYLPTQHCLSPENAPYTTAYKLQNHINNSNIVSVVQSNSGCVFVII